MITKERMSFISGYVDSLFPNAKCELFYNQDYELAIAVMLSAQTTDKAVNAVTEGLFKEYDSLEKLANADIKNSVYTRTKLKTYRESLKLC